jgi:predicted small lipoprotein YifL
MAYSVAVKQGSVTLMQTVKLTLLALLFGCLLAACGHKGPLYLPKDEPVAKPETSQDSKSKQQEDKEKKEAGEPSDES